MDIRKKIKTEIAALELIDRLVRQLDQGDIHINFSLDLPEAFDCILHKILAAKLQLQKYIILAFVVLH